jgi:hypothetical protein
METHNVQLWQLNYVKLNKRNKLPSAQLEGAWRWPFGVETCRQIKDITLTSADGNLFLLLCLTERDDKRKK